VPAPSQQSTVRAVPPIESCSSAPLDGTGSSLVLGSSCGAWSASSLILDTLDGRGISWNNENALGGRGSCRAVCMVDVTLVAAAQRELRPPGLVVFCANCRPENMQVLECLPSQTVTSLVCQCALCSCAGSRAGTPRDVPTRCPK
jgi:hypothetical protein